MNYFTYKDNRLFAEDVEITDLAERLGTPLYIYSARTLRRHFRVLDDAFKGTDHLICFAMKALSNLSILKLYSDMGAGFDIVSVGELMRCLRAGADARKIVFSGVGKTDEEIEAALKAGILMINVESRPELRRISEIAHRMNLNAPVSLRVNPDLDPGTHPHIGSQITETGPFAEAGEKVARIVRELREDAFELKYLDLGGGLGIPYQEEPPPPSEYARALLAPLRNVGLKIIIEPGRVLVGNAGILVTKVLYVKDTDVKRFIVVDGAMNDLIRPVLYEAYHEIQPVVRRNGGKRVTADVVGPVCESGDFFARERDLPEAEAGELLAVMSAGAYGFVMASNYNSRPRAPEVLVNGGEYHVVRERETFEDLIRAEKLVTLKAGPDA